MCSIFKIPVCPLNACLVHWVLWQLSSLQQDFFPIWLSISALLSLTELGYLAECACILFLFFQRQIFVSSWFFKHLEVKETYKTGSWCLVWRVLRARSIYFKPFIYAAFMIYAQTRQSCYSISLLQFFKAYCTFPSIFTQYVLIIGYSWLC